MNITLKSPHFLSIPQWPLPGIFWKERYRIEEEKGARKEKRKK